MRAIAERTDVAEHRLQLRSRLPYYQIARSSGITYKECVRLFKQIQAVVTYHRSGKILVLDQTPVRCDRQGANDVNMLCKVKSFVNPILLSDLLFCYCLN
ncbi:hypothetical protein [Nostoc sp. C117]|uniref:hypothetical protein n=1 Tax=Nostoc sp. C117 TaxID=3349875 RepID=UPI00370DAC02